MRKINTSDVCKFARIMKYSGMRERLIALFNDAKDIKATSVDSPEVQEFGVKVILEIVDGLSEQKAERELYDLLGGITEKGASIIENQEFTQTIEDIKAIARENDLKSFFSQVSSMISR